MESAQTGPSAARRAARRTWQAPNGRARCARSATARVRRAHRPWPRRAPFGAAPAGHRRRRRPQTETVTRAPPRATRSPSKKCRAVGLARSGRSYYASGGFFKNTQYEVPILGRRMGAKTVRATEQNRPCAVGSQGDLKRMQL